LISLTLRLELKDRCHRALSVPNLNSHPQAYRLLKALSKASKLRDLKISLGSAAKNESSADGLHGWLPRVKFPELRSLSFDMVYFNTSWLAQFLVNQQKLKHLVLKEMCLAVHWSSLFRKLSQRKDFVLDSIRLPDFSHDGCETFGFEHKQDGLRVRVSQAALLDYINLGGVNPLPLLETDDETTSPGQEDDLSDFPEMSELGHEETPSSRQGSYGHEYDPAFGVYTEHFDLDADDMTEGSDDDNPGDETDLE